MLNASYLIIAWLAASMAVICSSSGAKYAHVRWKKLAACLVVAILAASIAVVVFERLVFDSRVGTPQLFTAVGLEAALIITAGVIGSVTLSLSLRLGNGRGGALAHSIMSILLVVALLPWLVGLVLLLVDGLPPQG